MYHYLLFPGLVLNLTSYNNDICERYLCCLAIWALKLHSHAQKFVGRMYIRPTNPYKKIGRIRRANCTFVRRIFQRANAAWKLPSFSVIINGCCIDTVKHVHVHAASQATAIKAYKILRVLIKKIWSSLNCRNNIYRNVEIFLHVRGLRRCQVR